MAKAKGLTSRDIERRYILRPTLPTIITSFALLLIALWTGAPIFETVFNWPGLGRTLFQAIGLFDTPVIVGSTVIYAYLLAITVFLLDFIYALVDPRGQNRRRAVRDEKLHEILAKNFSRTAALSIGNRRPGDHCCCC